MESFKKFNRTLSIILMAVMLISLGSLNANPPSEEEAQKACRSDVVSLCKTKALFGSKKEVRNCLRENYDRLTQECQEVLNRGDAFKAEMKTNCGNNISQYCEQFEGDRTGMKQCIKTNFSKFPTKCQDFLKKNN